MYGGEIPEPLLPYSQQVSVKRGLCVGDCLPSSGNECSLSTQTCLSVLLRTDDKPPPQICSHHLQWPMGPGCCQAPALCLTCVSTTDASRMNPRKLLFPPIFDLLVKDGEGERGL